MAALVSSSGLKFTDAFATGQSYTKTGNFIAGNTGILTLVHYGAGSTNRVLTVTIGGTAAVKDLDLTDAGGTNHAEVWRATNMAGGTNAFSFTCTAGSGQYISLGVDEFSGLHASPLGQTGNSALGGTSSSTPTVSSSAPTTETDELVVALFVDINGTNWTSATPPGSYTESWEQTDGTSHEAGSAAFRLTSTIGTQTATFSTGASVTYVAGLVTYKNAAGGGSPSNEYSSEARSRLRPGRGPYTARQFRRPTLDAITTQAVAQQLAASASGVCTVSADLTAYSAASPVDQYFATTRNRPGRGPYSTGRLFRASIDAQSASAQSAALACAVQGVTTLTAALGTQIPLAAAASSLTTLTAGLSTQIACAAASQGVCTVTAALSTQIALAAAVQDVCTVGAALSTQITPAASIQAVTTVSATLAGGAADLASAISGQVTVTASLSTQIRLAATPSATATVGAALSTVVAARADVSCQCTVTASLSTAIRMQSTVQAVTTISATLTGTAAALQAVVQAQATVGADLTTAKPIAAAVIAQAQVSASLTTRIAMLAIAQASSTVTANLTARDVDVFTTDGRGRIGPSSGSSGSKRIGESSGAAGQRIGSIKL